MSQSTTPATTPNSDKKKPKTQFKNYMEVMVVEALDQWIKRGETCCQCVRCQMDMMALALNHLPPKYVVSQEGELYTQLAGLRIQSKTDVMHQVLEAIKKIRENPRH